jgi:nitroreductase
MNRRQVLIGGGVLAGAAVVGVGAEVAGMGGMAEYDAAAAAIRGMVPANAGANDLIRLATLAANSHNTQPWQFVAGDHRIDIRADVSRRLSSVDPDDHHLFASLGCAAENLAIAAAATGHGGEARFEAVGASSVIFEYADGAPVASPLFPAIVTRQSTRAAYDGRAVSADDLATLAAAANVAGVETMLITERRRIGEIGDLVVAGNNAQMADAAFLRELKTWLRFNPRQAMATADGLFSATTGNPSLPTWLGPHLFDFVVTAASEAREYAAQVRSSAGVAVFVSEGNDKLHWVQAGRAAQRFALQATALGLKHAFVNQAVEVPAVRSQLAAYLGVGDRRPDLIMRFGHGPDVPKSLRRPAAQVIAVA